MKASSISTSVSRVSFLPTLKFGISYLICAFTILFSSLVVSNISFSLPFLYNNSVVPPPLFFNTFLAYIVVVLFFYLFFFLTYCMYCFLSLLLGCKSLPSLDGFFVQTRIRAFKYSTEQQRGPSMHPSLRLVFLTADCEMFTSGCPTVC